MLSIQNNNGSKYIIALYFLGILAIPLGLIPAQVMNQLTHLLTGPGRAISNALPAIIDIGTVLPVIGIFFIASLGNAFLNVLRTALNGIYLEHLVRNRSLSIFSRIMRVDPLFFRTNEPSKICNRIINETNQVESFWLNTKLGTPTTILGLIVFTYVLYCGLGTQTPIIGDYLAEHGFNQKGNWLLASLILFLSPLQSIFLLFDKQIQKINYEARSADDEVQAITIEVMTGVREVRNHFAFDYALSRIRAAYDRLRNVEIDIVKLQSIFSGIGPTVDALSKCLTLAVGAYLCVDSITLPFGITANQIGWNDFMGFSGMAVVVNMYLKTLTGYIFQWRMVKESIRRLESYETKEITFKNESNKPVITPANDNIILNQVSFETEEKITILDQVKLAIQSGQHIAFVGPSGCGKSTAMNLLVRELKLSSGNILFDKKEIEDCNFVSVTEEIGFVQQQPTIFNMSLRDNLLLGLCGPSATDKPGTDSNRLDVFSDYEIDQKLIHVVHKVSLTADIQGKGLDNPIPASRAGDKIVTNATALRKQIQEILQKINPDIIIPYQKDAFITGASLLENIIYGAIQKQQDRRVFEKHLTFVQKELFSTICNESVFEQILVLGLQLFRRDQRIAMQIHFQSAKLFEILTAYKIAGDKAVTLPDLTEDVGNLLKLNKKYQRILFDIALQSREDYKTFCKASWLSTFHAEIVSLRTKLQGKLDPAKLLTDSFLLAAPAEGIPLRNVLIGGQINFGSHNSQEIIDKTILETIKQNPDHNNLIIMGLDSSAGISGKALSGGQAMKLALARILLKEPSILMLDEATAALDEKSQAQIVKMIDEDFVNKTVITISHRLSTIKNYDKIFVFDRGRIIQEGKWDELITSEGLFLELVRQERGESMPQSQRVPSSKQSTLYNEIERALALSPIFSGLRIDSLLLIERFTQITTASKDTILFERGDQGDEFFIILEGDVEFYAIDEASNQEKIIDKFSQGQSFGELALFGNMHRTLSARACTDIKLCVLTHDDMTKLMEIEPLIATSLLKNSAHIIAELREQLYR